MTKIITNNPTRRKTMRSSQQLLMNRKRSEYPPPLCFQMMVMVGVLLRLPSLFITSLGQLRAPLAQ